MSDNLAASVQAATVVRQVEREREWQGAHFHSAASPGEQPSHGLSLAEPARETGIGVIGDVPWGTHFCLFYQTRQDLVDLLVPYFCAGLANNEFCMWITSDPLQVDDARRALAQAVHDLDRYIEEGQIEILDYRQWYTLGGVFDSDRVLDGWTTKESEALARGFAGLRLTGNTFWLEAEDWQGFTGYEEAVNSVIGQHNMLALCTYSLERCGVPEVLDVVANHQFALIKRSGTWETIQSGAQKQLEAELRRARDELEIRVQERTAELSESRKQLQALSQRLVESVENERRTIARELHDQAGQSLTAMKLGLARLRREVLQPESAVAGIAELQRVADDIMVELHRLSRNLRPASLDRYGLIPALTQYVESFQRQTGVTVQVVAIGVEEDRLPPSMETALYRMVQEALTNVARHAHATQAGVLLERLDNSVLTIIEDNGTGFDVDQALRSSRLGLIGMSERTEALGGRFSIESVPGKGTEVFIELPLPS